MLSDYKRIIEKPMVESYEATIADQRAEIARLRDALLSIKGLVAGDKHPNWISDFKITQTRSHIADLCDVALRQTS